MIFFHDACQIWQIMLAMLCQIWQKGLADGEQAPREGAAPAGLIENGIARDWNARRPEAEPPATPEGWAARHEFFFAGLQRPVAPARAVMVTGARRRRTDRETSQRTTAGRLAFPPHEKERPRAVGRQGPDNGTTITEKGVPHMSTTINVLHSDGSLETFTTTSETTAGIRSAACRRLREADGTSVSFVRCGVRFTKTADRRGWRHEMAEPPAPLTAEEVAGRLLSCSGADVEALTDEERGWAEDVCMGAVRDLCVSDDGEVSWRGFADALADVRTAFSGLLRLDPFGTEPLPHLEPEWPDGHGSEDGPAEAGGFLSAVARPALTVGRAVATGMAFWGARKPETIPISARLLTPSAISSGVNSLRCGLC